MTVILQPVYHFRLTDTETGEFRNVRVKASSLEEAEQIVMQQEAKKVEYQLGEEELNELALVEKWAAGAVLTAAESERIAQLRAGVNLKGRLLAHRQEKPYTIVKAKEAA